MTEADTFKLQAHLRKTFGAPGITENPKIKDYVERIRARPAYQRSIAG